MVRSGGFQRRRLALSALLLLAGGAANAGEPPPPVVQASWARLDLTADLQNLFKFVNDADFDRSRPYYEDNGQTVGALATIFRPRISLRILQRLRIVYELELGLNYWSKNNPDQQAALSPDVFLMKHREIYGEGDVLGGKLGFRAGYSYFRDPTGLFLAHWIGNAQLWTAPRPWLRLGLFAGQIPDQVYEGLVITENNFKRDIWVFGAASEAQLGSAAQLLGAVSVLLDTHLPGQSRTLACPSLRLQGERGRWSGHLDAALQAGVLEGQALGGGDQVQLAWALQAGSLWRAGRLELGANLLLLSPDDRHDGNQRSHAFLYSGKPRSATLMLTEDEIRDWYDNLDERMSAYRAGFFQNRAGLFVGDLQGSFAVHRYFRPRLTVGVATVLNPHNALEARFVGVEADLVLEVPVSEHLIAHLVGGLLVPGAAGAALINRIDRSATDPLGQVEASLLIRY